MYVGHPTEPRGLNPPSGGYPVQCMRRRARQRTRYPVGFTALVAALAVGGCAGGGGSDPPSAAEKRAALDRWVKAADAACRDGNDAIAERGWPGDLIDLDRLTVRAITEIRETSDAVRKLRQPEGSEQRVRAFLASVKELEPVMDELSSTTEKFKPDRLNDLLPEVQASLADVEEQSRKLGLRHCAANDEHVWVPDAIRAPVFAQQLANLTRQITRRSKAVTKPASTQSQAARNLDRLSDVVADADRRINTFKPPQWADEEARRYVTALRALGSALDEGAAEFSEQSLTIGELSTVRKKFFRAARLERKRARKLLRAVGAAPVLPGGGGGEESSPGGEGTQQA